MPAALAAATPGTASSNTRHRPGAAAGVKPCAAVRKMPGCGFPRATWSPARTGQGSPAHVDAVRSVCALGRGFRAPRRQRVFSCKQQRRVLQLGPHWMMPLDDPIVLPSQLVARTLRASRLCTAAAMATPGATQLLQRRARHLPPKLEDYKGETASQCIQV